MEEGTSDLGKNGKYFNEIFSRQRRRPEKYTEIKYKTYIRHMHVVHLRAAQENILRDGEGNLNPSWSLAFSGF